jgi:Na+-driven multidrug efflux pump
MTENSSRDMALSSVFKMTAFALRVTISRVSGGLVEVLVTVFLNIGSVDAVSLYVLPGAVVHVAAAISISSTRGLETVTALRRGRGEPITPLIASAALLILFTSCLTTFVVWHAPSLLERLGVASSHLAGLSSVAHVLALGMPPICIAAAFTPLLEAYGRPGVVSIGSIILLSIVPIAWCIFKSIIPDHSAPNVAIAVAESVVVARWFFAAYVLVLIVKNLDGSASNPSQDNLWTSAARRDKHLMRRIGISAVLFETSGAAASAAITALAASQGPVALDAYRVAMNFLGIAMLATAGVVTSTGISVAYHASRSDIFGLRRTLLDGLGVLTIVTLPFVFLALASPSIWMPVFSLNKTTAISVSQNIGVALVVVFLQSLTNLNVSILRALKDIWVGPAVKTASFWFVGVPTVYIFINWNIESAPFIGLAIATFAMFLITSYRTIIRLQRIRAAIDEPPTGGNQGARSRVMR